jgi:hypothetical protein
MSEVLFYITVSQYTMPASLPPETKIKTDRGELRADELTSGEYGQLWGQPNGEAEYRWINVQRAYHFSIDFSPEAKKKWGAPISGHLGEGEEVTVTSVKGTLEECAAFLKESKKAPLRAKSSLRPSRKAPRRR